MSDRYKLLRECGLNSHYVYPPNSDPYEVVRKDDVLDLLEKSEKWGPPGMPPNEICIKLNRRPVTKAEIVKALRSASACRCELNERHTTKLADRIADRIERDGIKDD